jgi:hypothetical protein
MSISVKIDKIGWDKLVNRIESKLSVKKIDAMLKKAAWQAQKQFVHAVKSKKGKGTGETSDSWKVIEVGKLRYEIVSTSKVAVYLEKGTKAHGPVSGKFLYIPLKPGIKTWRKGQVYGKDYVLAKKVKGITARKYLRPISLKVERRLKLDFILVLQKIGAGK